MIKLTLLQTTFLLTRLPRSVVVRSNSNTRIQSFLQVPLCTTNHGK